MTNFDTVIFDFDGTVADTGEGIFECIRYAIRMEGLEQPNDTEMRRFIGPPLTYSFHKQFPEIDDDCVTRLLIHYRAKYSVDGIYKFKLYDGMEELLRSLRSAGVKTAVGSSKPEVFIEHIVKNSMLSDCFDATVGTSSDTENSGKKAIITDAINRLGGSNKALMVGDRKFDIDGAHEAGIPCAAVLFGYGSREEFEEHNAEYIVDSCKQLEEIIFN